MKSGLLVAILSGTLAVSACAPSLTDSGAVRPAGSSDLSVTATADAPEVTEGATVTLTATASGGTPPYSIRWDQNAGPEETTLGDDANSTTLAVEALTPAGRYVFRVTVSDSAGFHETDFVSVQVTPGVTVAAGAETSEVIVGESAALTTTVADGTEPFTFQWSLETGPAELNLNDATLAELKTEPLTVIGDYVFRVVVTDASGFESTDTVSVTVLEAVTASVPDCAIVGEPAAVSATVAGGEDASVLWEVRGGTASLEDATALNTTVTVEEMTPVDLRLTASLSSDEEGSPARMLDFTIEPVDALLPRVLIETNFGSFMLELDADAAPAHVENFLAYVDEGFYDGLLFHRNATTVDGTTGETTPFVLQGGGFSRVDGELELREPTRDPVPSEADNGLSNGEVYSVALALSGDPDSGSAQFFINLRDNSNLDEQGFTVFARVLEGTDVIDTIAALETIKSPIPPEEVSLPVVDVLMERVTRACN